MQRLSLTTLPPFNPSGEPTAGSAEIETIKVEGVRTGWLAEIHLPGDEDQYSLRRVFCSSVVTRGADPPSYQGKRCQKRIFNVGPGMYEADSQYMDARIRMYFMVTGGGEIQLLSNRETAKAYLVRFEHEKRDLEIFDPPTRGPSAGSQQAGRPTQSGVRQVRRLR